MDLQLPNNFTQKPNTHLDVFRIRANEVDSKGKANILPMYRAFQEAAIDHARILGLDIKDLLPKGYTWVLSRLYMEVLSVPLWRDNIWVHTWPAGAHDMHAIRDFEIIDKNGQIIARGVSSAMMIDIKKRRGVSVMEHVEGITIGAHRSVDHTFEKLPAFAAERTVDYSIELTVRRSDLDINGHVNAAQYISWALEGIPQNFYLNNDLKTFEISYRAETFYGETFRTEIQHIPGNGTVLHRIIRISDKRELARCRSVWVSK